MGIKIFGFKKSPPTLKTILVLEELGLEYEFVIINDMKSLKTDESIAAKNPFKKVPIMVDDGFTVYESRAICRYLINKYQGTKNSTILIPKDIQKSTLVDQFLSVETSYFNQPTKDIAIEELYSTHFGRETNLEKVKETKVELEKLFDTYEKLLEGKNYLAGEYSLADLFHVPNLIINLKTSAKDIFYDAKRPNFVKWVKTLAENPTWKKMVEKYEIDF